MVMFFFYVGMLLSLAFGGYQGCFLFCLLVLGIETLVKKVQQYNRRLKSIESRLELINER